MVIPYILYNVIIYPYWLLKYYLANGTMPDFFAAMRPIIGIILLQHENAFAEPLDGPLWYLPAILIMHVTIDLCRKAKHQHLIMIALCLVSFFLYAANKYWYFAPNLTPMGLMRNLPYYYIGYVMGHYHLFRDTNTKRDAAGCLICLTSSILLFAWHLDAFNDGQHLLHIALFYPANIGFLLGVLYGCKLMNSIKYDRHISLLALWSSLVFTSCSSPSPTLSLVICAISTAPSAINGTRPYRWLSSSQPCSIPSFYLANIIFLHF